MAAKRQYPRVGNIKDQDTQQSLRLLWDRLYDHVDDLATANAAIATAQATISAQQVQIAAATALARNASKPIAPAVATSVSPPGTGGGGGTPTNDSGMGEAGCSSAGATGHVDPSLPRDPVAAGMIVCGVGNEFPALLAVAANQAARDANRTELINRIIWHLNEQGFPASHYGSDPTSSGYTFLILIQFSNTAGVYQSAYRVTSYDEYTTPMSTTMVFGGTTIGQGVTPDGGTAD